MTPPGAAAVLRDQPAETIPAVAADGSLYPIDKMEAHRTGALHLAVSVFVFSGDELLIQRRAAGKYHSGLQWANTCCSHPQWNEPIEVAARRRLREELGCDLALRACAQLSYTAGVGQGLTENEQVRVFRADVNKHTLKLNPDPAEVAETRWAGLSTIRAEATARPDDFTPWFRIYLARWSELGL